MEQLAEPLIDERPVRWIAVVGWLNRIDVRVIQDPVAVVGHNTVLGENHWRDLVDPILVVDHKDRGFQFGKRLAFLRLRVKTELTEFKY